MMQKISSVLRAASALCAQLPASGLSKLRKELPNIYRQILTPYVPSLNQSCGFKVKGVVRRRCASCYFVKRDARMYVICPKYPRHKQMAMKPKPHNTWILTHASQSKVRPW